MSFCYRVFRTSIILLSLLFCVSGLLAITVTQRGNQLFIDGVLTPLTFARGCDTASDLTAYHSLGFNTLLVSIDSLGENDLAADITLMKAAEKEGLYVLIEMINGPWLFSSYANVTDAEYIKNATRYITAVANHFKEQTNIVGWVVSTVDEPMVLTSLGTFQDFLTQKYVTDEALFKAWAIFDAEGNVIATPVIRTLAVVGQFPMNNLGKYEHNAKILQKIQQDIDEYKALVGQRDTTFQAYLNNQYRGSLSSLRNAWSCTNRWIIKDWKDITFDKIAITERKDPGAFPNMTMDQATFCLDATTSLVNWWVDSLRKIDDTHLIFIGSQHRYRTLVTLPSTVNGVLVECLPGYAEPDLNDQNPHAIDIARRGNQFAVLAGVIAPLVTPEQMGTALFSAAVHGAAGICVTDWPTLRATNTGAYSYALTIRAALHDMADRQLLGRIPAPKVAFVYSPYAPGTRMRKSGLYGYMERYFTPGPGTLFYTLRNGAAYGQFDYLAASDLERVNLTKYSVLILPTAIDVPEASQLALLKYADAGGVVLADFGAGAKQTGADMSFLPEPFMRLFNINTVPGILHRHYNLEVSEPNELFPKLLPGTRTNGILDGYMMDTSTRLIPLPGTRLLFSAVTSTAFTRPTIKPRRILPLNRITGVTFYRINQGYTMFAPFPLYQYWLPGNWLFETFHSSLFSIGADIALERPIDFVPALATIARYSDGSVIAWTKDSSTRPVVDVKNTLRQIFDVRYGQCELRPDTTVLSYDIPGFYVATPLPIIVAPLTFTLNITTIAADDTELSLSFNARNEDAIHPVVLQIGNGHYPVIAGSQHRVMITLEDGTSTIATLIADNNGIINLTLPQARATVQISSATATPTVPDETSGTPTTHPNETVVNVQTEPEVTVEVEKKDE